jgi:hypothetical protein
MNLQEKINAVKSAPNMVEVEGLLNSITSDYLTRYANEVEKAPQATSGHQSKWIGNAVRFFIADIHRDKLAIWQHIPERFHSTKFYERLKLSQFVTNLDKINHHGKN